MRPFVVSAEAWSGWSLGKNVGLVNALLEPVLRSLSLPDRADSRYWSGCGSP